MLVLVLMITDVLHMQGVSCSIKLKFRGFKFLKKDFDYQIWPPIFADQLADSHTLIHPPLKEPAFVHT